MKKHILWPSIVSLCLPALLFAQPDTPAQPPVRTIPPRPFHSPAPLPAQPEGANFSERLQAIVQRAADPNAAAEADKTLPRFDLDFKGGTPAQLVHEIGKATGKPVNVIIPDDASTVKLPGFSVKNVNVARLFEAIETASRKTEVVSFPGRVETYKTGYGFRTVGPINEDSVWSFFWDRPPRPVDMPMANRFRFFQLGGYIDAGYKVDDITTAIQTALDMLGQRNALTLTYHKDTQLLIAVGDEEKLGMVQNVLDSLRKSGPAPRTAAPK